jgi:hypothetical protein
VFTSGCQIKVIPECEDLPVDSSQHRPHEHDRAIPQVPRDLHF